MGWIKYRPKKFLKPNFVRFSLPPNQIGYVLDLSVLYSKHNTKDCSKYEKDGSEKANIHANKKGGKNPDPTKNSFALLSKKFDKLTKVIKKQGAKLKKRCRDNSYSDSE